MPSVHELFTRAFHRGPTAPPDPAIPWTTDDDGARVVIELRWAGESVAEVCYRSSVCVTLLALCESLLEWLPGLSRAEVVAITAAELLVRHPEVPVARRSRAAIVERALHRAVLWKA